MERVARRGTGRGASLGVQRVTVGRLGSAGVCPKGSGGAGYVRCGGTSRGEGREGGACPGGAGKVIGRGLGAGCVVGVWDVLGGLGAHGMGGAGPFGVAAARRRGLGCCVREGASGCDGQWWATSVA